MSNNTTRRYSLFPKPLATCVEQLTRPLFKAQASATARLITEWDSIAGAQLARHTAVEKLSFPQGKKTGGTLTIAVENGFATEFQHMEPIILDRLADYFGYRAIARIAISHSFVKPAAEAKKPAAPHALLPPDCSRMAEKVDDNELKEALQSLAKTLSGV